MNSWEAAYFTFDGQSLLKLAKSTAALGIDMIVMDDGWFGKREDDNSGLGDWQVNEKKLGCTLRELIEKINREGVKFGIWIEPEMVSEDSELYRQHPDWVLRIPGRSPSGDGISLCWIFPEQTSGTIFSSRFAGFWIREISSMSSGT